MPRATEKERGGRVRPLPQRAPASLGSGRLVRAGALALVGLGLTPAAQAETPTSEDFQITYYTTDEYGERVRQMDELDMQQFVNTARCECGHSIIAKIQLDGNSTGSEQLRAMVGQECDTAQASPGLSNYYPCAQLVAAAPAVFQQGPEYAFEPIWLAYGSTGDQAIATAVPSGECSGVESQGGVWVCSGTTSCTNGDFLISGDVNVNTEDSDSPQGISVDFVPPVSPPTSFTAEAGDSAVKISWTLSAVADIAGYRVLCADANGDPVDNGIDKPSPSISAIVNGTIYYTRDNLCPGGVFGEDYDPEGSWEDEDEDEDDTGDTTEGGDETDTGTDTGTDTDTDTDAGTDTDTGCTAGEVGCECGTSDTCDVGLTCESGVCVNADSEIYNLGWEYVCSNHIAAGSSSARIEGLENGQTYQFLVVAYDYAGNPVYGDLVMAAPVETDGLWEQCENQGGVCGSGWSCSVVDEGARGVLGGFLGLLGLGLGFGAFAWRRRRRG
ncbi:hypothetical protein G6O69_20060 [Pseudenhygromyxa sp. WMMC2535]|uniref:hypothetical protein n=1 Tax=Pseudenhygromyxa sp. WMMC2535 TaxID=2712867 RepID=UPI001595C28B|nr:hypothetical protein [Pseudenhygromyxa sp. WMMC2535]NVB40152.1 hypothetical protein [Pseudenhygromyxa sp. WMMC2535]